MRFGPEFLEELRRRLPIAEVVGRRVALKRRGRSLVGLCPFHQEKTPSFTVHDDKGFYHCFGCQAHGDVIDFVMRSESSTFPEAVERVARLAGVPLPAPSPGEAARERAKPGLYEAMEAAARWFEGELARPVGARAREYLAARGVGQGAIARFRLGFAPDARGALKGALMEGGRGEGPGPRFPEALLIEAGLLIAPDGGGPSFDRFRDRIIFPIADSRGRVIALGGRALGEGKPKYLNSPETPLFRKSRVLYNLAQARAAARGSAEIVVAEGYMDVIALDGAGFANVVAPLGTALTEEQLGELWRIAREPILCFDGDEAGEKAAAAAAERALPLLKPGFSLRFSILPPGEDPDSLIRARGPEAVAQALASARPLADLLWTMETVGRSLDTPERRAHLRQRLHKRASQIADPGLREEYRRHFEERLAQAFPASAAPARRPQRASGKREPQPWFKPGEGTKGRVPTDALLERSLVATVVNHPEILDEVAEELGGISFSVPEAERLRQGVLEAAARPGQGQQTLDSGGLKSHLRDQGFSGDLRSVLRAEVYQHACYARPEAPAEMVRKGWREAFGKFQLPLLRAELHEAQQAVAEKLTPENQRRFFDLKKRLYELQLKAREWTS